MYGAEYGVETYETGLAMGAGMMAFWFVICVFMLVVAWKLFVKAGKPGWASIVPIYNIIVFGQIAGFSTGLIVLMFIPIFNIIPAIMLPFKLAEKFDKSTGFAVGLLLLSPIFMAILAFDDSQYQD